MTQDHSKTYSEWTTEAYTERTGLELLPHHHAQLTASAISLEVAAERGYWSATTKAEIQALGFAAAQLRPPALVVPLWSVDGDVALHQIRPDEPRRNDGGKLVKYESPRRAALRLDIHPRMRTFLGDPERPLFVTEGLKKGDAAATADLCCVALLGVSGWRGRNQDGGVTALADWEHIALRGRRIYLVFDSDVMTKTQVYMQLGRLRTWLASRGAEVFIVYLPSGDGAAKTGLDDFLAAGNTRDDLLALATADFRHPDNTEPGAPTWEVGDYRIDARQGTFRRDREGEQRKLADFAAYIERKDIEDDGDDLRNRDGAEVLERLRYHLVIQQGTRTARHSVTAAAFHAMRWPPEVAPLDLIVSGGSGVRDYLREAIELASREVARHQDPKRGGVIPRRTVYIHTGWRVIGGKHVYLHAGGGIGEDGAVDGAEVRLSPQFARLVLPPPADGDQLVAAVQASTRLLELGPDEIMVPLLGAVYRSVLAPSDFSVHSYGDSGRFKSEVMALAQSHFGGPFDSRELPLSWTSTGNSLEGLLHEAASMAVVVDDFLPAGLPGSEREAMLRAAARVFRAQGNQQGRSRMRADSSIRAPKDPRGLTLSTGEEIPPGLSQVARVWLIEQTTNAITSERLTAAQNAAGLYAPAMAGYLRWLAPRMGGMRRALRSEVKELRATYQKAHRRTADIAASLEIGWSRFMNYALDCGAITERDRAELATRVRSALLTGAAAQAQHLREVNPVERYVSGLSSALSAGVVYVSTLNDRVPPAPGGWGWRPRPGMIGDDGHPVWEPRGERVGWIDGDSLYLLPEVAYKAAAAQHRDGLGIGEAALRKRLHDAGTLVATSEERDGRLTVQKKIGGRRERVLHLRPSLSPGTPGTPGTGPGDASIPSSSVPGTAPQAVPGSAGSAGAPGTPQDSDRVPGWAESNSTPLRDDGPVPGVPGVPGRFEESESSAHAGSDDDPDEVPF